MTPDLLTRFAALRLYDCYHLEREYARSIGDPLVCRVLAESPAHAEQLAASRSYFPSGVLALEHDRADDGGNNPPAR